MTSIAVLPSTRLVRGAPGTIPHQFTDSDGEPSAPPSGALTVAVTRSNGDTVTAGAIGGTDANPRTTAIAVTALSVTDWLTAVWSLDGVAIASDTVEVVGGTLGSNTQLRATDPSLNDVDEDDLRSKRRTTEDTSLAVLNRGIFERFYVERIHSSGRGPLILSFPDLIQVAWVRTWSGSTSSLTTYTAEQIASIPANASGLVEMPGYCWPCGDVEVGYRFGMRACPGDLLEALRKSVRHAMTNFNSGVPAFAASMQTADGFNFGLAGPANENWATGDITIDRVVNRYKWHSIGMA